MISFANATASAGLDKLSETPFYFSPRPSVVPGVSDKYLSLFLPFVIYWAASLFYHALDVLQLPFTEKYRLHEPEEISKRNRVSMARVIWMVLLQQLIQTALGLLVLEDDAVVLKQTFADHQGRIVSLAHAMRSYSATVVGLDWQPTVTRILFGSQDTNQAAWWLYWWGIPIAQLWFAFFVMDAWQYMLHRLFHESRWLYRNFHSHHHRLYVPYAFGALYNHPVEGKTVSFLRDARVCLQTLMRLFAIDRTAARLGRCSGITRGIHDDNATGNRAVHLLYAQDSRRSRWLCIPMVH